MEHLAFYNSGCEPSRGPGGPKVFLRRRVRNLLLPMFLRLVEILGSLCYRLDVAERDAEHIRNLIDDLRRRQEEQAAKVPSTLAFGWDYVAMVRRLAILEEHVDALLAARDAADREPAPRSRAG
jgi:hypothetical protein